MSSTQSALMRVFSANVVVTALGVVISFLLPLSLSPADYGYWQLYALYVGYAGVFMLGFNDGVYLNYAGSHYDDELFRRFRTFRIVVFSLSIVGALPLVVLAGALDDVPKRMIVLAIAIYVLMAGSNGFCAYVNQSTLRFRQYTRGVILERVSFLLVALVMVGLHAGEFLWYMGASLVACLALLVYNVMATRELFSGPRTRLRLLKGDIRRNFASGFALMVAVLLNQSMIVVGRLVIESRLGIEAFAGYSFALTVVNVAALVMLSVAQVMFPVVRRTSRDRLPRLNRLVDLYSSALGAVLLLGYFPVWIVVDLVYTSYSEVLPYLALLFPLAVFQGKFQLIVVNGCKVAGRMRQLLVVSSVGVALEVALCFVAYGVFGTVLAIVVASVLGYVLQYYFGMLLLSASGVSDVPPANFLDLMLGVAFVTACLVGEHGLGLASWPGLIAALGIYLSVVVSIALVRRRRIVSSFRELREFLRG